MSKVTLAASMFICLNLCLDCTSLMHERILKKISTSIWKIQTVCCLKEPCFCLKGQGHICILNVYTFIHSFFYSLEDFKLLWYKYLAYQDDVPSNRTMSLSQNAPSIPLCPFLLSSLTYWSWGCLLLCLHKKQSKIDH